MILTYKNKLSTSMPDKKTIDTDEIKPKVTTADMPMLDGEDFPEIAFWQMLHDLPYDDPDIKKVLPVSQEIAPKTKEELETKEFSAQSINDIDYYKELTSVANIEFLGCQFYEIVDFSDWKFTRPIDFRNSVFHKKVIFENAVFEKPVSFWNVKFLDDVSFKSCVFGDSVNFGAATFSKKADFECAGFDGKADFKAQFSDEVNFKAAVFRGEAIFSNLSAGLIQVATFLE